jgi:hypothetical protein
MNLVTANRPISFPINHLPSRLDRETRKSFVALLLPHFFAVSPLGPHSYKKMGGGGGDWGVQTGRIPALWVGTDTLNREGLVGFLRSLPRFHKKFSRREKQSLTSGCGFARSGGQ